MTAAIHSLVRSLQFKAIFSYKKKHADVNYTYTGQPNTVPSRAGATMHNRYQQNYHTKSSRAKSGRAKSGRAKSGRAKSGRAKSGRVKSGRTKSGS